MSNTGSWFLLLIVGIFLVIVGVSGSMGRVFAVIFAPGILQEKGS